MSEHENPGLGHPPDEPAEGTGAESERRPTGALAARDAAAAPGGRSRELMLVPAYPRAERPESPRVPRSAGPVASRFALAAAALGVVAVVAGALLWEHRSQADLLAQRANETETLAQAVESLQVRLDAIDGARSSDELADLRRSIGDMKSSVVSAREFSGAVAQLAQRVDKLDHEQGAKVDKLTERVDREASALTAEVSARFDKLEKMGAAPVSAAIQAAPPLQPPVQPRFNANVSMETTASIDRPKPVLRSYIVLDARDDVALVGGRFGEREVRQGDFLPGAGRVERIERKGEGWIIVTSNGLIPSGELPPY